MKPVTWTQLRDGHVDLSRIGETRWLGTQLQPSPEDAPYRLYPASPVTAGDFLHGITKEETE